jgi:hypothetical protein
MITFEERRDPCGSMARPSRLKSSAPAAPSNLDDHRNQHAARRFSSWRRPMAPPCAWSAISKPVAGTVVIAVAGAARRRHAFQRRQRHRPCDLSRRQIPPPGSGDAGFEFDVPVRFDTDKLEINVQGFRHGAIPHIPIVEVRL